MNDDNSTRSTDELRAAFQRAATGIDVPPTPPMPAVSSEPPSVPAPVARRFGALLVAAAVVLVAGLGAWSVLHDEGSRRVDSGPARPDETDGPPVTLAPEVLEQSGVWRLPEGLDGYELVGVQETGFSSGWAGDAPGRLVVDDPEDPRRWLMVEAYDQFGVAPAAARSFRASDEVEGFVVSSGDGAPIWFQIDPVSADVVVSGAAFGVDEAELVDALTEVFAAPGNSMPGEGFDASIELLTERFGLTDGEILAWQGEDLAMLGGADASQPSIELTLVDTMGPGGSPTGPEVVVRIAGTDGAPAWAQILRLELTGDLSFIAAEEQGLGGPPTYAVRRRPDLGRNIVETRVARSGLISPPLLSCFTDDGVLLSADHANATSDPVPAEAMAATEQLRIISSLVAMTDAEFVERLAAAGIEFIGAGSAPGGQTVGPTGPATTLAGDAPD